MPTSLRKQTETTHEDRAMTQIQNAIAEDMIAIRGRRSSRIVGRSSHSAPRAVVERARRAGVEPRLKTIELMPPSFLGDWKEMVLAFQVVTFSCWTRLSWLVNLLLSAANVEEARRILRAFRVEEGESYLHHQMVKSLRILLDIVGGDNREEMIMCLEYAATCAGLEAQNTVWEYDENQRGLVPVGQMVDFHPLLARGLATFDVSSTRDLLAYWENLANAEGDEVPIPEHLNKESILRWVRDSLASAYKAEEEWAPRAGFDELEDGSVGLRWDGTWTEGRSVRMMILFDEEGLPSGIVLNWVSGTGNPSTFLKIENLLALKGCKSFSTQESE